MKDYNLRRLAVLALVLLIAIPAFSKPYDMVIVGDLIVGCYVLTGAYRMIEWHPFWLNLPTDIFTVTAAPGDRVYASLSANSRIEIVELKADRSRTPFFSGADGYSTVAMAVGSSGNVHVLTRQGAGENAAIVSISSDGALVATNSLGFALRYQESAFDLASDQCTVAIGASGAIRRFDVCTGSALPALVSVDASDLAFLPNGDVLAASDLGLRRYDSSGALLHTIALASTPNAIALRGQGNSATVQMGWCDDGQLADVNLITGAVSYRPYGGTSVTQARAILVSDGWTAALGPAVLAPVPTISNTIAIVFAALAALRRMS